MNLVWLRNDLRIRDNCALKMACESGPTIAVFIATPQQWRNHNESPNKISLLLKSLNLLRDEMSDKNIPLKILECGNFTEVPEKLLHTCQSLRISNLWFNRELLLNEMNRDAQVTSVVEAAGVHVRAMEADLIHQPSSLKTKANGSFKVFTPFYKAWLAKISDTRIDPLPPPVKQQPLSVREEPIPDVLTGWELRHREDLWPAGRTAAMEKLDAFINRKHQEYPNIRDYPAVPGTSLLSPYLSLGIISVRECIEAIKKHDDDEQWKYSKWAAELAWREFYRHLIATNPDLCKGNDFRPTSQPIRWQEDETLWRAWCEGNTGFPLVDAAMRQLNQTGWMHNRLRMVTASFLTKLLMIDWRRGEAFFMQHLIDGDYASNNGGWQWAASTGADAAPYFRIFNPTAQSEKFDPEGKFIKRFVPELGTLSPKTIHNPTDELREELGYPIPIIDYKSARKTALANYEAAFKAKQT